MEISKERLSEMMTILDNISKIARSVGDLVYRTYVLGPRLKHLRHESKWAYYGLEQFLESDPDALDLDVIENWLIDYFNEPEPDSSERKLIELIVSFLKKGRLPTYEDVCICYDIECLARNFLELEHTLCYWD